MAKVKVGIIAEDKSDVEVIEIIAKNITATPFSVSSQVGRGCGKINAKALGWAKDLQFKKCTHLILVHDLDDKNYAALMQSLTEALKPCPINKHAIVIPTRELEAWLLADHATITSVMKLRKPMQRIAAPESINNPKEHLRDVIWKNSGKSVTYINTLHNAQIARVLDTDELQRCPSFLPFAAFIQTHL
jgi:hypothetical protein